MKRLLLAGIGLYACLWLVVLFESAIYGVAYSGVAERVLGRWWA